LKLEKRAVSFVSSLLTHAHTHTLSANCPLWLVTVLTVCRTAVRQQFVLVGVDLLVHHHHQNHHLYQDKFILTCIHWTTTIHAHIQMQKNTQTKNGIPPDPNTHAHTHTHTHTHTHSLIHMVIKSFGYLFIDVCLQSD